MKRLRWWDSDWAERQRINEAADELNQMHHARATTTGQIARVFQLDQDQGREIARLQTTLMTLIELMVEKGVVEEQTLVDRVDAALNGLEQREQELEAAGRKAREVGDPFSIAPRK